MIPNFPDFKKLELSDKEGMNSIVWKFPPFSDFNFTSLYSYNTEDDAEISTLNENLVIKFRDYITNEPFFSFLGINNVLETTKLLLQRSKSENFMNKLQLVPQTVIEADHKLTEFFNILEDPDNHDYILSVNELSEFSGGKFYDKRNLVNRFKRLYPDFKVKILDINDLVIKQEIIDMFFVWEEKSQKIKEDTQHEFIAIKRLLKASETLNLYIQGIYVEDRMIAFTIKEIIQSPYSIIHFEKCDKSFEGISSILRLESAKFLKTNNIEFINFEQDLGIEGLKKAKQLWRPVNYLKKYIITEKI